MGIDVGGIALTSPGTTLSMDSGATNWMKVNASGILTRPQTPFMRGQLGTPGALSGLLPVKAGDSVGGCWNDSTSYFTCPVAGYYMATGAGIANTQAGYFSIVKNGAGLYSTHWNHTTTWHYVSISGDGGHGMYSIALMA
jgi:hypothetical protein